MITNGLIMINNSIFSTSLTSVLPRENNADNVNSPTLKVSYLQSIYIGKYDCFLQTWYHPNFNRKPP